MEQDINIKERLTGLLAVPEKVSQDDTAMLKDLAKQYPYFQPVHLLMAKATLDTDEGNTNLATAAIYTNGQLLHNFLHETERLESIDFNVINYSTSGAFDNNPETLDEVIIDEVPSESEEAKVTDDQEIFDEIGEVNVQDYNQARADQIAIDESKDNPEDDLVLENIVATDFFAFQENFKVEPAPEAPEAAEPQIEEYKEEEPVEEEDTIVISKYDDDQLPYTFLWWLAKTRKEHQQIFQPYASPKQVRANQEQKPGRSKKANELQQQYVENIFHMQSPFDEEENEYSPNEFKQRSKGAEIIESFIKNEPQISPPKPEQINNENKAKKSAEDHNDLVSETLANIYIEQMLYDKAIETYEKLSLMFPEKSRYFADLIQSIEKKFNNLT
nr:hypothetical protein [Pedobacter panaciterrae]